MIPRKIRSGRPPTICLWGAWYGSENIGDHAVLISICQLLRERLPEVRLVVLSENRAHIERYMAAEGIQVRALDKWRQLPRTLLSLARADAFVLGGGVPIYDKPSHTAVFAALIGVAKMAGCRTATFGIASQTLTRRYGAAVLRRVIGSMDLVAVRDPRTLRQLRAVGIERPILLTADPAFLLEPANGGTR